MPKDNNFLDEMKDRYERVFSSEDGQKVLEDIAISGLLRRSSFSNDALILAHNVGMNDLAQHILDMAKKDEFREPKQTEAIK
jgi:hypothetical protein